MKNKNKSKSNKISLSQLVLLGLGSLIGSGWLFGAWRHLQWPVQPPSFPGLSVS